MRMSAGNSKSLMSFARRCFAEAIEHPSSTTIIRSAKIVLRLGVARVRPPRRSPGIEPLGMYVTTPIGARGSDDDCQRSQRPHNHNVPVNRYFFITPSLLPRYPITTWAQLEKFITEA